MSARLNFPLLSVSRKHILRNLIFLNLYFFIIIIFYTSALYPQSTDIIFQQLFLEHGLSQSIVKSICQDKRGFIYFGTEDGLNRYDGYGFTVMRHKPKDTNSLSYNDVTTVYEDHEGIIWIGTFNAGLNRFDPSEESFSRFQFQLNDNNSISHNNINCIFEDNDGTLWIGTDNGLNKLVVKGSNKNIYSFKHYFNIPGDPNSLSNNYIHSFYQAKNGTFWIGTEGGINKMIPGIKPDQNPYFVSYKYSTKDPKSLSNNIVRTILEDKDGDLWVGTDDGLNRFEQNKDGTNSFTRYKFNPANSNSLSHNQVYALCEDNSGILWIGTNGGGLTLYDKKDNQFTRYLNDPQNPRSLSYNEIRTIYKDISGIIWIGTYGSGINKVTRGVNQFLLYSHRTNQTNSLSHPIVWSIQEDEDKILWIGTHGGGLDKLDRKTHTYSHFVHEPGNSNSLSNNIVRVIFEDKEGYLWLGTHGGGVDKFDRTNGTFKHYRFKPDDPASLSDDEIRSIYQDRAGTIWIGTYGRGLNKFIESNDKFIRFTNIPGDSNSLSNDFVRVIYEDNAGNFWIGTEGGGLNKFDRKTGVFKRFRANPNNTNSISNDYIFSIHEGAGGILWMGTFGGGLNKFNPVTQKFKYYTVKNGLPSDAVYGILADKQGNLWLSTNNGLSRFNPRTEIFKNYTDKDGLQSNEFNGGSYFKSRSGEMFFGGINGFNAFFPANIKENNYVPPVVITSFQKFNKAFNLGRPIPYIKKIALSYEDYVFSFEFSALDYSAPGKNKYAYKMEGLDKDWVYTTSEKRFANYTTLPAGKYLFRVKGSNSDGVWNENGTSIELIIAPPFWQTWWFSLLITLLFVAIAYFIYKRRLNNVRLKTELKTAHDAQMSIMPHSDPVIEGLDISSICIPANEVGGDFFDYFWSTKDSTRVGIMIGDVSGKAMNAAMTAIMTSGMLITEVNNSETLSTILSRVNEPLYYKTKKQMFTAVILACIDLENKEITLTNAGLVYPMLKSNGHIEHLKSVGPRFPLGMLQEVTYQDRKIKLNTGSVLIFMTDGVTEARDRNKEQYGEKRLEQLLLTMPTDNMNASQIKDKIINEIIIFTGKRQQHDDMTMIVVKIF